jgi:Zn-finger nucleic acid-binding protein
MDAGTLHCPKCGAVVAQDSTQCAYCHALLQTVACSACMGMMFLGSKFCPHCGVPAADLVQGPPTPHTCPRCNIAMEKVEIARTPLEECLRCGGLWVDVSNFERICSDTEAREAATGLRLPPPVPIDTRAHYLKCPTCTNLMNRMNYASRSGIIINVCGAHGVWLDRDEIRQIIEFIKAGGLDHARKMELEHLEEAVRLTSFEPANPGGPVHYGGLNDSLVAEEQLHLLNGIASVANHFLGSWRK